MTINEMLGSKRYSEVATKMASWCEDLVKKTAFLPDDEVKQLQNASETWKQRAKTFDVKQWRSSAEQLQEFLAPYRTKNVVFPDSNEVKQLRQGVAEIVSYLTNSGQK